MKTLAGAAPRKAVLGAGLLALVSLCGLGPARRSPARAAVPVDPPVFSSPLEITNEYFPVVPGTVKVYTGREDGEDVTIVETHLEETRVFEWEGRVVPCRVVETLKFVGGRIDESDRTYFAQADDGTVYFYGETEDEDDEDDEDEPDDPNGWIVGQRIESDPENLVTGAAPTVFMPANPETGDLWNPELSPPHFWEQYQVLAVENRVRVPAGRLQQVLRVRETDLLENSGQTNWFAPGVGFVKSRGKKERLRLKASTMLPRAR